MSGEYEKDLDEFQKAGFIAVPSDLVRSIRMTESTIAFECKIDMVTYFPLGEEGSAGYLVLCKILCIHAKESILDNKGLSDPIKMD
ncbi:MAG: hypothetical protein ABI045_04625 [Flavobacteriales bacterium]